MENKIPTAEEFLLEYDKTSEGYNEAGVLRDFAKLHVQQALQAVIKQGQEVNHQGIFSKTYQITEDSILNAYDINNIK